MKRSKKCLRDAVAATAVDELLDPVNGKADTIRTRVAYEACAEWCREHRLPVPTIAEVAVAIRAIGGIAAKTNGQRIWRGVRWRVDRDGLDMRGIADRETLRRLSRVEPRIPLGVFCELVRIGRRTFYDMRHRGTAPEVHKINGRCLILSADALQWCRTNGRHAALIALADWLDAELERPSSRVIKAASCGAVDSNLVRETGNSRTCAA